MAAVVGALAPGVAQAQLPQPLTEPAKARIVFNADADIYSVAPDGSGRTRLLPGGRGGAFDPSWSPDGRSIAFLRGFAESDDDDRAQIWAMAADGSGARPVSSGPRKGQADVTPAWSPDGQRIAFVRLRFGEEALVSRLMTAAASGGDERVITEIRSGLLGSFGSPAWSPDGNRILLTQQRLGKGGYFRPALYVVDVATGARTKLLRDAEEGSWSPDGERIAYTSVADRNGETCGSDQCNYNGEIYVMRADGSGRVRLTESKAAEGHPDWSADGERIAFASDRNYPPGENPELYSIRPDGSCLTWLTNGTAGSAFPDWEPAPGGSTDPGGCGAVPREPLIETDTGPLARFEDAPVWWLGPRFGDLLLREARASYGHAYMSYDDCARFEPSECPEPLLLDVLSTCQDLAVYGSLRDARPRNLARHEGALVNTPTFADEESVHVNTGPSQIDVDGRTGAALTPVLDGLRRFGEEAPPAHGLPLAQLPVQVLRPLERTRAAYRKYGSARRVARVMGGSRAAVRDRLALDRRLRRLGPFGRIDCRRR
jgi:Tol biopolymer transport system component